MPGVLEQLKEEEIKQNQSKLMLRQYDRQVQLGHLKKFKSQPFIPPRWARLREEKKKLALSMLYPQNSKRLNPDVRVHKLLERVHPKESAFLKISFSSQSTIKLARS
jgi:hypothetical protein